MIMNPSQQKSIRRQERKKLVSRKQHKLITDYIFVSIVKNTCKRTRLCLVSLEEPKQLCVIKWAAL